MNVNHYENNLKIQMKLFLACYNGVGGRLVDIDGFGYNLLSSIIGHYIYMVYDPLVWTETEMSIPGDQPIMFGLFKGTRDEGRVAAFLDGLYQAFNKNDITQDVEAYMLSGECTLTGMEKETCMEFYNELIDINKKHIAFTFQALDKTAASRIDMTVASDKYDMYLRSIAQDQEKMRVLGDFDKVLKRLAMNHKVKEVVF